MNKENLTDLENRIRSLSESVEKAEGRLDDIDDSAKLGFDAAILVHELSNILGGMMGHVQLAQITGKPDDMKKSLDVLGSGLLRTRDLIATFKQTIMQGRSRALLDLHEEIRKVMVVLEDDLARNGITWKLDDSRPVFFSDPTIVRKAVFLCALTAAHSFVPGTPLDVKIRENGGSVEIDFLGSPQTVTAKPVSRGNVGAAAGLESEWEYLKALIMEIGGRVEKSEDPDRAPGCRLILQT